jgi:hypothetical protein
MEIDKKSNMLMKLMEQLKRDKETVHTTMMQQQEKFINITDSLIFNMPFKI